MHLRKIQRCNNLRNNTSFAIDRIDVLKMDCEGAEYDICMTAPRGVAEKSGFGILVANLQVILAQNPARGRFSVILTR